MVKATDRMSSHLLPPADLCVGFLTIVAQQILQRTVREQAGGDEASIVEDQRREDVLGRSRDRLHVAGLREIHAHLAEGDRREILLHRREYVIEHLIIDGDHHYIDTLLGEFRRDRTTDT
jgi:hypothetical protein